MCEFYIIVEISLTHLILGRNFNKGMSALSNLVTYLQLDYCFTTKINRTIPNNVLATGIKFSFLIKNKI